MTRSLDDRLDAIEAVLQRLERHVAPAERAAFPLKEAAAKLGVSTRTLQRMMDSGAVRAVVVGARRMVPLAEILRVTTPAGQRVPARPVRAQRHSGGRQRLREMLRAK